MLRLGDVVSVKGWDGLWTIDDVLFIENGCIRSKPYLLRSVMEQWEQHPVHIWVRAEEITK